MATRNQCIAQTAAILDALIYASHVNSIDVVKDLKAGKPFTLDSSVGKLDGKVILGFNLEGSREWTSSWLHLKFQDVELAKTQIPHGFDDRLNAYSGKYNFMFSVVPSEGELNNLIKNLEWLSVTNLTIV